MRILYLGWDDKAWRGTLIDGLRKAGHEVLTQFSAMWHKYSLVPGVLIKSITCDVVLGDYVSNIGYVATKLCKPLGKPVVVYARGGDVDTHDPDFPRNMNINWVRYAVMRADIVMCVSKYVLDRVLELCPEAKYKVQLVYNGVDTNHFRPDLHNLRYKLLAVGSLLQRKGFDAIIKALSDIVNIFPKASLTIVGKDVFDNKKRLLDLARKVNVTKHINFTGYVSDEALSKVYRTSDVFVHVPRNEPFGVVLIEAMASGLPVVATSTGGIPEIVPSEFLVTIDDHDKIAEKVCEIFRLSDEERWRIGMENRRRVQKKFTLEHQVNGVIQKLAEAAL